MPTLITPPLRQADCAVTDFASAEPPEYAWRSATMSYEGDAMRDSMIAASLASVPELVKKLFCSLPGVISASFSASATTASLGKSVEVCCSLFTCALIFEVTFGLQWPTPIVTMPPKKSRYLLPSMSHRYCIEP